VLLSVTRPVVKHRPAMIHAGVGGNTWIPVTSQYKTILVANVPRVKRKKHGVATVSVPWAESGSGFTVMFEALVTDWLKEASSAVSRLMGLSWNAIDGIMQHAVERGLSRREKLFPTHIGVDETAFRKQHDYVTVVSDQEAVTVLHVGSDRKKTLKAWYEGLTEEQREAIELRYLSMEAPEKQSLEQQHSA